MPSLVFSKGAVILISGSNGARAMHLSEMRAANQAGDLTHPKREKPEIIIGSENDRRLLASHF